MKQLSIRQWLILSWLLCLALPRLLFELVETLQHAVAPSLSDSTWLIGPLATALATTTITILGVNWLIGNSVLKPLSRMQQAAQQIAAGDLDFSLPRSRVREVNQVAAAFTAMGDGLRAAITRQAALEQERRLLISTVAHDLRTPLFALRGYLEGIEQGVASTPEQIAHYLAVCREQAAVLGPRINALFDSARLEYLEQPLQSAAVDWPRVASSTVERLQLAAALKGVAVQVAGPAEPCMLAGDVQLLERMLENLLENALRHTSSGGTVELRWWAEPGRLCFSVADSGAGIAPEDLPQIFQPMYRGDRSRNSATGGAGLGLTVARRIAQAHGGDLSAANRPAGGAELTGWLGILFRVD
jgi:signal transduction histidine kinase